MSCSVCLGYDDYRCPVCGKTSGKVCPDCEGSGHLPYMAYDIMGKREISVTEQEWNILPDNEDEADDQGARFCKVEIEVCPTCMGEGRLCQI